MLEDNHGTDDPKDELISPEQLKFTEAISKTIAKELAPLIANRDQTAVRPTLYRGSKDGTVEEWLLVMKRYLERVYSNASSVDKAWAIFDHLGDEAPEFYNQQTGVRTGFSREGDYLALQQIWDWE